MPDDTTAPDPVTACLAGIRGKHLRHAPARGRLAGYCAWDGETWPCGPSRLLAAVEAVRELAATMRDEAAQGPERGAWQSAKAHYANLIGQRISAALTGEDGQRD